MLQADIPVIPVPGASSSSLIYEPEATHSSSSSTVASNLTQRFYRIISNDRPQEQPAGVSAAESAAALKQSQMLLESTRQTALYTLTLCRNVIAILELTRLRKSRVGLLYWIEFWDQYYGRRFGRALAAQITYALGRVDGLFRAVASELHALTQRVVDAVTEATTETEILQLLERMEDEVGVRRRRRRKKAQSILNKMRASLEAIPVRVNDELLDDLKRGVFALDIYCDYYPGDPINQDPPPDWTDTRHLPRRPLSTLALSAHGHHGSRSGSAANGAWMSLSMPVHHETHPRQGERRRNAGVYYYHRGQYHYSPA